MKNPEKGTVYFEMLVMHCFGPEALRHVDEGKIVLPEDMLAVAVKMALKKFRAARDGATFEEMINNLSDCRQLLSDIEANFADIGIEEEAVRELLEKMRAARRGAAPSRHYHDPDVALDVTVKGTTKLLPS